MFQNKRPLLVAALTALALFATPSARADDPKPGDPPAKPSDETRGYVGYTALLIEGLTVDQRSQAKIDHVHGLYVAFVGSGMPAEKAGLQVNDVLLSVNGHEIPDTSKVDVKDKDAVDKYMSDEFGKIVFAVKPGDTVTIVVDRQGRTETVKAVAVSLEERKKIEEAAQLEANAEKIPDWKPAGSPNALSWGFEGLKEDKVRPDDLFPVTGYWEVAEEDGVTPVNHVLHQKTEVASAWELSVVTGPGHAYADGTITTRWSPQGGEKSVSGGIAFRAQTWKNFYVAVADGVAKTLSIVLVKNGAVKELASKPFPSPKLHSWHTLEVSFVGTKFKATVDGGTSVEAEDATFSNGWAGPCVAQDADTYFDDWKASPGGK